MTIRELLNTDFLKNAQVLSSKNNLDRQFDWCMPDPSVDLDDGIWILPGLLLLYVGRSPSDSWTAYLDRIIRMDAAGLIFIGERWSDFEVTEEALLYADTHKLPIIWISRNMSITRFISRIFPYISVASAGEYYKETWLKSLCYTDDIILDELTASNYGYNNKYRYYCLLLRLRVPSAIHQMPIEKGLGHAYDLMFARFSARDAKLLAFADGDTLVCFLPFLPTTPKHKAKERIQSVITELKQMNSEWKWKASVGTLSTDIKSMGQSFRQATRVAHLIKRLGVHEKVSFYDDWHMHMVLLQRPESELQQFMLQSLEPLIGNDELLHTLTVYLISGENLKVTAEQLYIHPSTLKYRMGKIREALDCNLDDSTTRFRLRMAITIHRYLTGAE